MLSLRKSLMIAYTAAFPVSASFAADPPPAGQELGKWHVELVKSGWSPVYTLATPGIQLDDQDKDHEKNYENDYKDAAHKIEGDTSFGYDCSPGPESGSCAFVDFVLVTQIDEHTVHYHIKNHGGRCVVKLRIRQHDPIKVVEKTADALWVVGGAFVVFVPVGTIDSTVVGRMGNNDVFFTPTSPLQGDDAKRFHLSQTKVVDGVGTYYSFRVVNPYPS